MKCLGMAVAVVGLLAQAGNAYAISFAPPRPVAAAAVEGQPPAGISLGLAASSWGEPDQVVSDATIGTLGWLDFSSKVRPLVTAEYRVNDKFSVGGWYSFISWDTSLRPAPWLAGALSADAPVDGGILEVHGTYALPNFRRIALSAQVGYEHTDYSGSGTLQVVGAAPVPLRIEKDSDRAVAWGLATCPLANIGGKSLGLMGGLGLAQGLNDRSGSTQVHGLVGASLAVTPSVSADASLWVYDFASDRDSVSRFTAGLTGRF